MDFSEGVIIPIDKPYGMTSFGALAQVRYLLSRRLGVRRIKVGHAGTLDPLATGVLLLCTGRATKQIDSLQQGVKEYVATLQLGATTPSFDMEHPVDATYPAAHITQTLVQQVLERFVGDIEQVPPAYSACKVEGKRAYELKRGGEEVQLKAKTLRIDEIELTDFDSQRMQITIRVVCSKGTYIRALARDIGVALDSGAYLTALRRIRVGQYTIDDCITLDCFAQWLEQALASEDDPDNEGAQTELTTDDIPWKTKIITPKI